MRSTIRRFHVFTARVSSGWDSKIQSLNRQFLSVLVNCQLLSFLEGDFLENDVLFKVTQANSEKGTRAAECSYQESNLRPSDY